MKLLGIDYGAKRIGIAIGDTEHRIATPLTTLVADSFLWAMMARLMTEEQIAEVVIGIPLSMREGTEVGETVTAVRHFLGEFTKRFSLPIHEEDERFSTDMAGRFTNGSKKDRDAIAAAIILQSYLDRLP